jgi:CHAT domain-containing protein
MYGSLSAPEPVETLLRRVKAAPRSTAFVSLFVTHRETLMFVLAGGSDDVRLLRLAVPDEQWKEWLDAWMDRIQRLKDGHEHPAVSRPAALDAVAWLHEVVAAPLIRTIGTLANISRLVFVPHRLLHGVPFHAAFDRTSGRYLGERFTISSIPALQMWGGVAVPAPGSVLIVSNPTTTLSPLFWAEQEARALRDMFDGTWLNGEEATVDAFLAAAPDATMIHVGCHAQFEVMRPELSALVLAHGERLTARQIASVRFPALQLVMTAACQSGRNRPGAIDEALGLPRAWLLAGAQHVLSALWDVEDKATHEFVLAFYEQVKLGASFEDAYSHAQRTLLASTRLDRDPRMWASFVITGPRESAGKARRSS